MRSRIFCRQREPYKTVFFHNQVARVVLFLQVIDHLDCFALKSKIQAFFPVQITPNDHFKLNPASRNTINLFNDVYNQLIDEETLIDENSHTQKSYRFYDTHNTHASTKRHTRLNFTTFTYKECKPPRHVKYSRCVSMCVCGYDVFALPRSYLTKKLPYLEVIT